MRLLILYIYIVCTVYSLPDNPCPGYFKYVNDGGYIYGELILPTDRSGDYIVGVNVSLPLVLKNVKLELKLLTSAEDIYNGADAQYRINFPVQYEIPKIVLVTFNDIVYCRSTPYPVGTRGVTNLWAQNTLHVYQKQSFGAPYNMNFNGQPFMNQPSYYPNQNLYPQTNFGKPTMNFGTPPPMNFGTPPTSFEKPPSSFEKPISNTGDNKQENVITSPAIQQVVTEVSSTTEFASLAPFTSKQPSSELPELSVKIDDTSECGVFSQNLVVGGTDLSNMNLPWLVAIFQHVSGAGGGYAYRCTGNLVSNKHVISAGHCFKFENLDSPKEDFHCVLGKNDISNWARSTIKHLKDIRVHPQYSQGSGDADLAVLTFDTIVEFSDVIKSVCIWNNVDSFNIVKQTGTVVGWGTDGSVDFTSKAKKVDLNVVSNEECLRSHWGYTKITSNRTFCAGGENIGPCTGDSGSGLILRRNGVWTLRGIVSQAFESRGEIPCDLGKYIVLVDIKYFVSWIREVMTIP